MTQLIKLIFLQMRTPQSRAKRSAEDLVCFVANFLNVMLTLLNIRESIQERNRTVVSFVKKVLAILPRTTDTVDNILGRLGSDVRFVIKDSLKSQVGGHIC